MVQVCPAIKARHSWLLFLPFSPYASLMLFSTLSTLSPGLRGYYGPPLLASYPSSLRLHTSNFNSFTPFPPSLPSPGLPGHQGPPLLATYPSSLQQLHTFNLNSFILPFCRYYLLQFFFFGAQPNERLSIVGHLDVTVR